MLGVVVAVSFVGAPASPPTRALEGAPRESAWQNADDPSDSLVLLGFPSERAAQDDLRRLFADDAEIPTDANLPTEVHHVAIEHEDGDVLDAVPLGGVLATVRILASPGYGPEARERLEETLSTFAQLEGHCGHLQGFNESNEDEAWAFVFSTRRSATPLPENHEVLVRLYRRVA